MLITGPRTETTVTVSSLPSPNSALSSLASLSASSVPVGSFRSSFVLPLSSIREHYAQESRFWIGFHVWHAKDAKITLPKQPSASQTLTVTILPWHTALAETHPHDAIASLPRSLTESQWQLILIPRK